MPQNGTANDDVSLPQVLSGRFIVRLSSYRPSGTGMVPGEGLQSSHSEIDGGERWRRWRVFRFQLGDRTLAAEIGGLWVGSHRRVSISERAFFGYFLWPRQRK